MQEAELERIDSNFTRFNAVLYAFLGFFLCFMQFLLKNSPFLREGGSAR